jgi:hypothetical protein
LAQDLGPWNPGISSDLPQEYLPLTTIFRSENTYTPLDEAQARADLTGLKLEDAVAFRPQRLVAHELLLRIMADFKVPDGQHSEDLGINFRAIMQEIMSDYIAPQMDSICAAYETMRANVYQKVMQELDSSIFKDTSSFPHPPRTNHGVLVLKVGIKRFCLKLKMRRIKFSAF